MNREVDSAQHVPDVRPAFSHFLLEHPPAHHEGVGGEHTLDLLFHSPNISLRNHDLLGACIQGKGKTPEGEPVWGSSDLWRVSVEKAYSIPT